MGLGGQTELFVGPAADARTEAEAARAKTGIGIATGGTRGVLFDVGVGGTVTDTGPGSVAPETTGNGGGCTAGVKSDNAGGVLEAAAVAVVVVAFAVADCACEDEVGEGGALGVVGLTVTVS